MAALNRMEEMRFVGVWFRVFRGQSFRRHPAQKNPLSISTNPFTIALSAQPRFTRVVVIS